MNSQKLFAVYNATSILAIPICLIGLYIVYSYINEVTPWLTLNIGLGTVIYEIYDKMSVFDVYQLNVNISSVILITPLFIHGYTDDININVYFIISFAIFPLFSYPSSYITNIMYLFIWYLQSKDVYIKFVYILPNIENEVCMGLIRIMSFY